MSSQVITPNTEAANLTRIIQADDRELTPDAARYLLSMQLPSSDEARVNELSAKARAGSLTEDETQELDGYLRIGSLLAVMHSRARRLLKYAPSIQQSNRLLSRAVRERAGHRCEYCSLPQSSYPLPFPDRPCTSRKAQRRNK